MCGAGIFEAITSHAFVSRHSQLPPLLLWLKIDLLVSYEVTTVYMFDVSRLPSSEDHAVERLLFRGSIVDTWRTIQLEVEAV